MSYIDFFSTLFYQYYIQFSFYRSKNVCSIFLFETELVSLFSFMYFDQYDRTKINDFSEKEKFSQKVFITS